MLDVHGMMRHVFVEIREDQQQLEHAIALFRLRLVGAFFQVFHRSERIGKQPLHTLFAERRAFAASCESLVCTQKCFIEKMIEAKLRTNERSGRKLCAPCPGAMDGNSGFHPTPLILEQLLPRG